MATVVNELVWIHQLLQDFQVPIITPVLLFCDNQVAIHIATNSTFHERTKNIEIDCHFVRDKVTQGFLRLMPIRSLHQLADIFTKPLSSSTLFFLIVQDGH